MSSNLMLAFVVACAVGAAASERLNPDQLRFHQDTGAFKQQINFKPEHSDRGYVQNCGPEGGYFNISWFPKEIDPTRQIYLYGDIVSPVDFQVGKANASMSYMGQPMLTVSQLVKCEDVFGFLPDQALDIKCPIKKGQRLSLTYVFPNTERLIGYDGDYKVRGELMNSKGELLMCVEINATIKPFA